MGRRRNQVNLISSEKLAFVNAVLALINHHGTRAAIIEKSSRMKRDRYFHFSLQLFDSAFPEDSVRGQLARCALTDCSAAARIVFLAGLPYLRVEIAWSR